MPTRCFGPEALVVEDCCRCQRPVRQQNALYQVIAGEERWFCLDCAIDVSTSLLDDVRDLAKVREMADRAHEARASVLGEYAAVRLSAGLVG